MGNNADQSCRHDFQTFKNVSQTVPAKILKGEVSKMGHLPFSCPDQFGALDGTSFVSLFSDWTPATLSTVETLPPGVRPMLEMWTERGLGDVKIVEILKEGN